MKRHTTVQLTAAAMLAASGVPLPPMSAESVPKQPWQGNRRGGPTDKRTWKQRKAQRERRKQSR